MIARNALGHYCRQDLLIQLFSTVFRTEFTEEGGALAPEHALGNLDFGFPERSHFPVRNRKLGKAARLRIGYRGAENYAPYSRPVDCGKAHWARLAGRVDCAAPKLYAPKPPAGVPDCAHLCMGSDVGLLPNPVVHAGEGLAAFHYAGAERGLPLPYANSRRPDCQAHEFSVFAFSHANRPLLISLLSRLA
jgi:hypothetical protein